MAVPVGVVESKVADSKAADDFCGELTIGKPSDLVGELTDTIGKPSDLVGELTGLTGELTDLIGDRLIGELSVG